MDGIGLFTHESLQRMVKSHPEVEFVFIFDRKPDPEFVYEKNVKALTLSPQARDPFLYYIWYQLSLPRLLKKLKVDLFVSPDGMIPLKMDIKTLAVVHDLNFEHFPEYLPKRIRKYYQKYFPAFVKKADRIATVSEYSKQDIINTYNCPTDKIDVVYNGANINYKPNSESDQTKIKEQFTEGKDFFLFVGTLHPRKNLINLFKAFGRFKEQSKSDMKLLVVGRKMWWSKEAEDQYKNLKHQKDIVFTGRIDAEILYQITASAYALTYVPFFEGFGIPIIEAMSSGTPVITSNLTSMPEVAGDAAILVDPTSIEEIANAMISISEDQSLHQQLINSGLERSKVFTWDKTANLFWESIQKTLNLG